MGHVTEHFSLLDDAGRAVPGLHLEVLHRTLPEALDEAVATRNERVALSYFDSRFTFAEVRQHAWTLADYLREQGVGKGDRILVQLQNVPQFVFTAFAAWILGAVLVPVSPMYRAREVKRIAADSGAVIWVTAPETWARQGRDSVEGTDIRRVLVTELTDFGSGIPDRFTILESVPEPIPAEDPVDSLAEVIRTRRGCRPDPVDLEPGDTALLAYTSGTTGPPKGAIISHANLLWVGHAYPVFNGVAGPDQVLISTAPLVHITGLAMHLTSWVTEACEFVLNYRFDPVVHLELMERFEVTWTTGAATAYNALLRKATARPRDLSALKSLGSGGAPIPTDMVRQVWERFGVEVQAGYGLTESTAAVSSTPGGRAPKVDEASGIISVGIPMFDTQLRIADPDGHELPTGERGEVLLKGPGIITGYWRNTEASEAAFTDGWIRTGDIGFVDPEGWLYIVDRTKNMIVASGYKVWPREVEDVLYSHAAVREAAVVGTPDAYRGETVVAYVSLDEDSDEKGKVTLLQELREYCAERLAAYKVPRRIFVKEDLPKNFNGKIQHRDLKAEASAMASAHEQVD